MSARASTASDDRPQLAMSAAEPRTRGGWFVRLAILVVAALVGWRVVLHGLADTLVDLDRPAVALAWFPDHPEALYRQARAVTDSRPEEARALLQRAAIANPTDARLYLALAQLPGVGDGRAERLMALALELGPMRVDVQQGAAVFWAERGDSTRALQHMVKALTLKPDLAAEVFPTLLTLSGDPAGRELLDQVVAGSPSWWGNFVEFAIANAGDARDAIYLFRHLDSPPPWLRRQLLTRLEAANHWNDAYFVWLNGLDEAGLAALGNIFDGGFELPIGERGFGWRYEPIQGGTVETLATYGSNDKALRLRLDGSRFRFRHLLQVLLLPPNDYRLEGRVRPDGLQSRKGVVWTVTCLSDGQELGRSDAFLGSSDWDQFVVPFRVSDECGLQALRLQQDGEYIEEFRATGSIWFDDLHIQRDDPLVPRLAQ